tara:strand:- start:107 stop:658 length:552 start_codon:yes stop_codon:yes gene_type:complete
MISIIANIKKAAFFIIFVGGFTFAAFMLGKQREEAKQTLTWPTVKGEITFAQVKSEQTQDSDGRWSTVYFPSFKYLYNVDGIAYTGNKYEISKTTTSSSSSVYKTVSLYPVGKKVDVYYNPLQENEAILKPGVPTVLNIIFYVFSVVVSILWLVLIVKFLELVLGFSVRDILALRKDSSKQIG